MRGLFLKLGASSRRRRGRGLSGRWALLLPPALLVVSVATVQDAVEVEAAVLAAVFHCVLNCLFELFCGVVVDLLE